MGVEAPEAEGDEADARLDEPARGEGGRADGAGAVALADRGRFLAEAECFLGLVRAEDFDGLLVEGIEAIDEIGLLVELAEPVVEGLQKLILLAEVIERNAVGQGDPTEAERGGLIAFAAAVGFDAERVVAGSG